MSGPSRWAFFGGREVGFHQLSRKSKVLIVVRSMIFRIFAFEAAILCTSLIGLVILGVADLFASFPVISELIKAPLLILGGILFSLIFLFLWESISSIRMAWHELWLLYTPNSVSSNDGLESARSMHILSNLPHQVGDYNKLHQPEKEDIVRTFRTGTQGTFLVLALILFAYYLDTQNHVPPLNPHIRVITQVLLSTVLAPIKATLDVMPLIMATDGKIENYAGVFYLGTGISFTPFSKNFVRYAQLFLYTVMDEGNLWKRGLYLLILVLTGFSWVYGLLFGY